MTDTVEDIRIQLTGTGSTEVALFLDDLKVSWTYVIPMTIRIGLSTVRMDGIGGVGTHEEHRYKGYSRRVLEAAVQLMKDGDASLTTLYGIPDFYPKFGYATVGAQPIIRIPNLEENDAVPAGYAARTAGADDLEAIAALYDDATRDGVGVLVRPRDGVALAGIQGALAKIASSFEKGDDVFVALDPDGVIRGYAWQAMECWWIRFWHREEPDSYKVGEMFAATPQAADVLLAEVRRRARASDAAVIELSIPATGTIGLAARLQNTQTGERNARAGEFMGRTVGISSLMSALEPELSRRQLSVPDPHTGLIVLDTGEDRVTLALTGQAVRVLEAGSDADLVIRLTPGDAARLALGTFDPLDLAERQGWPEDARPILATLFPERRPYIYPADRF